MNTSELSDSLSYLLVFAPGRDTIQRTHIERTFTEALMALSRLVDGAQSPWRRQSFALAGQELTLARELLGQGDTGGAMSRIQESQAHLRQALRRRQPKVRFVVSPDGIAAEIPRKKEPGDA